MTTDETGDMPNWLKGVLVLVAAIAVVVLVAVVTVVSGGSALPVFIGAAIGAGIGGAVSVGTQLVLTGTFDIGQFFVDIAFGMISGAFGGSGLGHLGMAFAGAGNAFGSSVAKDIVAGERIDWTGAAIAGAFGFIFGSFGKGSQNNQKHAMQATKKIMGTLKSLEGRSGRGIAGLQTIFKNQLANSRATIANKVFASSLTIKSLIFQSAKLFGNRTMKYQTWF